MKFTPEVIAALAVLREHADNDFERHRIDVLERDLTAPPQVEVIDDTHQKFDGVLYKKTKYGYYLRTGSTLGLHRTVWTYFHGEIPIGYEIHHKDITPSNNNISNLQMLTKAEHKALHKALKEKTCPVCGKKFVPQHKHFVCCSRACSIVHFTTPPLEKTCPICGKKFTVTARQKTKVYCSVKCRNIASTRKHIEKICPVCQKNFIAKRNKQIYCSQACAGISRRVSEDRHKKCIVCGKEFVPSKNHFTRAQTCSHSCTAKLAWQKRHADKEKCLIKLPLS